MLHRSRPSAVLVVAALVAAGWAAATFEVAHAAPMTDSLAQALEAGSTVWILAQFTDHGTAARILASLGDRPGFGYVSVPALAFEATPAEVRALARTPGVTYLELGAFEPLLLDTATEASRALAVWGTAHGGPIVDPVTGAAIDGTGVGIAVVDSGVSSFHPDLQGQTIMNVRTTPIDSLLAWFSLPRSGVGDSFLSAATTEAASDHGTHVAGIALGDGSASNGKFRGAAPGARLYAFGAGAGQSIFVPGAAAAFDWVLQH
ncbi:MAG TPA: S8 family serine peptidase, partial [Candidatus Thermoplasmatota archaeon]|nr:S8 family serine peptidase [Candidatus Thermoplasmatota archaeon]